jgi:DNA-binding NtrC family response regulator
VQPFARVALTGNAPAELVRMLPLLGVEALTPDGCEHPDLLVSFSSGPTVEGYAGVPIVRMALRTDAPEYGADFVYESPRAAACFILSRALGLAAPLITADREMLGVVRAAIAVAPGSTGIVVEGETGTGKESLVRLIHAVSGVARGTVDLDCAAPGVLENRLFCGMLTVFLHRLSELTPAGQAKLLELMRWGNAQGPLRYIATSSRSLALMGERGMFLPELLSRFGATLRIPPLRARRSDIPMLARQFLRSLNPGLAFSASAIKVLSHYPFPGNLRELRNLVTRLAIAAAAPGGKVIDRMDVLSQLAPPNPMSPTGASVWKITREKLRREVALQALAAFGGGHTGMARGLDGAPATAPIPVADPAPKPRKSHSGRNRTF